MIKTYYVIKPTTIASKKVSIGDVVSLSDQQARPLHNGGFVTFDGVAAKRITELLSDIGRLNALLKQSDKDIPSEKKQ